MHVPALDLTTSLRGGLPHHGFTFLLPSDSSGTGSCVLNCVNPGTTNTGRGLLPFSCFSPSAVARVFGTRSMAQAINSSSHAVALQRVASFCALSHAESHTFQNALFHCSHKMSRSGTVGPCISPQTVHQASFPRCQLPPQPAHCFFPQRHGLHTRLPVPPTGARTPDVRYPASFWNS